MENNEWKAMNVRDLIKSLKSFPKDAKVIFTTNDKWAYPPADHMHIHRIEYDEEVQIVRMH